MVGLNRQAEIPPDFLDKHSLQAQSTSFIIDLFSQRITRPVRTKISCRSFLENLITVRKADPWLFAAGPNVARWSQPGRVVERARPEPVQPLPRQPANPGTAFRAHQSRSNTTAIGCPV